VTLRVGVSACLLGQEVRYDGGHRRSETIVRFLGRWFEWIPVCPEMEIGLGVPRETIGLVDSPDGVRLLGHVSGRDLTATMNDYAARRARELAGLQIAGYVFKARSPSCGLGDVPVAGPRRPETPSHRAGLFAAALTAMLPELPVIEETRLARLDECRRFIRRVRAYGLRNGAAAGA
jgi:uncharacterized protein YbbK (DUF523 family)